MSRAAPSIAVALALALAGCNKPSAQGPAFGTTATAKSVAADAEAVVAAYNAHDAERAVAFDAPDYVGIFHGGPNTVSPAADLAGMKQQLKDPLAKWEIAGGKATVPQSGDIGIYEASYTLTMTNPATGSPINEHGNWIAIFKRQPDGTMKLWRSIGSDVPSKEAE